MAHSSPLGKRTSSDINVQGNVTDSGKMSQTSLENVPESGKMSQTDLKRESVNETDSVRQARVASEIDRFFGGWSDDPRSTDEIMQQIREGRTNY